MDALIPHKLSLEERSKLTVSGVSEVLRFDDTAVALATALGELMVYGQQLTLKKLSPEDAQVAVEGQIAALIYEEPRPAGRLWRKKG